MQMLAWQFHVGHTTVHKIIKETCQTIWTVLSPLYLKTPSSYEEWEKISRGFWENWNFPHCLGALDGKHVNIQAPPKSGSLFFNYKKTFSIVLLAACDSTYKFTFVDIGAYGSQSDGGIFQNSIFGKAMERNEMDIPPPSELPNSHTVTPYFFVADEAFPLKTYIMRPYPGKNLSHVQRIFNYRLSRARQLIENTFGILAARWRILRTTINADVANVDNMVKAVVILHNFCQTELRSKYCPSDYTDTVGEANGIWRTEGPAMQSVGRMAANVAKREIYGIRDNLARYFVTEAPIPWQDRLINKGLLLV